MEIKKAIAVMLTAVCLTSCGNASSIEIVEAPDEQITEASEQISDDNASISETTETEAETNTEISEWKPDGYVPRTEVTDDHIAVFHGGDGELTYQTYIYKLDTGSDNSGFEYIYTESYGMTFEQTQDIIKIGCVQWTDDVFTIAEENNTYSFVTLPNDSTVYSIDEFRAMFLMN